MSGQRVPSASSRRKHSAESRAKISASARARYDWDAAKVARIKAMVLAGASGREISRKENVYRGTLVRFCKEHNLDRARRLTYDDASTKVLREHYGTNPDLGDVLRRYREARGAEVTIHAMRLHAARIRASRPRSFPGASALNAREGTAALYAAARLAMAPKMQALLDGGMSRIQAATQLGMSPKRAARMMRDGVIRYPDKPPKPAKVRATKPPKPERPKAVPKSWVRTPTEPPKPRAVFQTVDEWVKAGGIVTRCPAAVLAPTTHSPSPDDAEALRAYYAAKNAQESGTWKQRAKKKMGRIFYGKAAV
jgi:hypothetical protein